MQSINPSKIELSIKDSTKGQKIAAALYLVTSHLSDTDPLKLTLRSHATLLMDTVSVEGSHALALKITDTMTVAVMSRLISEKNASIIILELRHFVTLLASEGDTLTGSLLEHFDQSSDRYTETSASSKKTLSSTPSLRHFPVSSRSEIGASIAPKGSGQAVSVNGTKSHRQEQILSLINDRKSAGIKDIAGLFPDTSEKTIQRELGSLVAAGRITKRGQKRWSVYMAVTA
jgi:hypothetical protein